MRGIFRLGTLLAAVTAPLAMHAQQQADSKRASVAEDSKKKKVPAATDSVKEPISVPSAPPPGAAAQRFHDRKFGVRFSVPPGWSLNTKDREVSTFALDARSAPGRTQMRGVASIEFNPFPLSNFSGAMFYFSVQKHVHADECAREAYSFGKATPRVEAVGGSEFAHGHDEHGTSCVEARDEVYTTYRKGSCYRFDLEMNTFCTQANGALEMSARQKDDIERRMETILSSVELKWKAGAPPDVPVDAAPEQRRRLPAPAEEAKGATRAAE